MKLHDKKAAVQLYSVSKLNTLLSHLEHVSKRGDSYRARCPAHDGKNTSTLKITEVDDRRILVHCFHGCGASEVMEAIGMEMTDLMPERLTHHATPEQRRKWRQDALHRDWCEYTKDLMFEADVVFVAGLQIEKGEALDMDDSIRLKTALKRIQQIRSLFDGQS
jgi:hypothetical protein